MTVRWIAGMGLALACSACGGAETDGGTGGGSDSGGGVTDTGGTGGAFQSLYAGYFQNCRSCHVPGAWGSYAGIERTLDFSTIETAYTTLTGGRASGLVGNQEACNGVRFVGATYETSLVAAVLDENVRASFSDPDHPGCDADAISDMTVKVGSAPSSSFLNALANWINSGAPR